LTFFVVVVVDHTAVPCFAFSCVILRLGVYFVVVVVVVIDGWTP
jgi:hypothetical protein